MDMELRIQAKGITKQYGATSLYPLDGSEIVLKAPRFFKVYIKYKNSVLI